MFYFSNRIKSLEEKNQNVLDFQNEIELFKENLGMKQAEYIQEEQKFKEQIESLKIQLKEEENKRIASEARLSSLSEEFSVLAEQRQNIGKDHTEKYLSTHWEIFVLISIESNPLKRSIKF